MKSRAGFVLMSLAGMWSVTAAWLSANEFIGVRSEILNYKYCLLAVTCGAFYFIKAAKGTYRSQITRSAISAFALLVVVMTWGWSDGIFAYWKLKAVSVEAWHQAAADLEKLAREAPTTDRNQPWAGEASQLPRSVGIIGLPRDYAAGLGGTGLYGSSTTIACVTYGFKPRTWGLLVADELSVRNGWGKFKIVPVSTNAYFFFGPDY